MTNNLPLVSIVIPTYNHSDYLRQSINSVLEQDYPNIELIVLDDGSTDRTRDLLEEYGNRFYWESQQNMGQSSTLNKGWNLSKGCILGYLSADDLLLPNAVSRSVECLLGQSDVVLSYCDFDLIDPQSRKIRRVVAPDYDYLKMVTEFVCAPGPGAFFLRTAFMKTGGWNPQIRRFPDFDCWLRLGLHGKFARINQPLAAFRVHEGSQSFSVTPTDRAVEAIKVIENYYALTGIPSEILSAKSRAMGSAHLVVAQLHLRSGRYMEGFREIVTTAHLSPSALMSFNFAHILFNGFFNRISHKVLWILRTMKEGISKGK